MEKFRFLEQTGDLKFEAWGSSQRELFENAALALFSGMFNIEGFEAEEWAGIQVSAESDDELLKKFLDELLFRFSTEGNIFMEFKVSTMDHSLTAECGFIRYDNERHECMAEIKAVTYHDLLVENNEGLWHCVVVCDI